MDNPGVNNTGAPPTNPSSPPEGFRLTLTATFPYLITLSAIAILISIFNFFTALKQALRIKRPNLYNVALCVCSAIFVAHASQPLARYITLYSSVLRKEKGAPNLLPFVLTKRVTWALASITYLMIVQSRFSIVTGNLKRNKFLLTALMSVTILLWIPYSIGGISVYIINSTNPLPSQFFQAVLIYDIIWDAYFVSIDLLLGSLTLKYILRFSDCLKQVSIREAKITGADKEVEVFCKLTRNVACWMGTSFFWIFLNVINFFQWGEDKQTTSIIDFMITTVALITNALQFSFTLLWLNNLKSLLETGNRIRSKRDYNSGSSSYRSV